jgi:hypothetical protein
LPSTTAPAWRALDNGRRASGNCHDDFAAHLGRHVLGLQQILDGDRQPVDHGQRTPRFPASSTRVGGGPRTGLIAYDEGFDRRFARGDGFKAAFQIRARRIGTVA